MPVWHRHPGPFVAVWSMVSAEWAFVEAPVGENAHTGVWFLTSHGGEAVAVLNLDL